MKMNQITEGLGRCDHCWNSTISIDFLFKDLTDSIIRCTAELAKRLTVVPKAHSQTFRDGEYPLSVWHIGKHLVVKAVSKHQGTLLVT